MLTAARAGDVAALSAALQRDATLVGASYWYMPPLHFAVREGHPDAVRLLVAAGADLTHRNALYGNDTLLQMAVDRGHERVADYLRQELRSRLGSAGSRHPIHAALAAGDAAAVERLLGADRRLANRGDHLGRRPLHYAVAAGRRDLVDVLLDAGADIDTPGFGGDDRIGGSGFRPLVLALWHNPYWGQRNDYAMARHLLERGADHSITVAAALGGRGAGRRAAWAAMPRRPTGPRRAASGRCRPPPSAATSTSCGGSWRVAPTPISPRARTVRAALPCGPPPATNSAPSPNCCWPPGRTPTPSVESSGTPTSAADDAGLRALLYPYGGRLGLAEHFHRGATDTIAALLDAQPAMFDAEAAELGFTHCVASGHEGLLRLLLARGLRVPPVVTYCQTYLWRSLPLARAACWSTAWIPTCPTGSRSARYTTRPAAAISTAARLFLEFGADPDAVDEEFRSTPLGWAARRGQREFVQFLLNFHGAAANRRRSRRGRRARAWAQRRGHHEDRHPARGRGGVTGDRRRGSARAAIGTWLTGPDVDSAGHHEMALRLSILQVLQDVGVPARVTVDLKRSRDPCQLAGSGVWHNRHGQRRLAPVHQTVVLKDERARLSAEPSR